MHTKYTVKLHIYTRLQKNYASICKTEFNFCKLEVALVFSDNVINRKLPWDPKLNNKLQNAIKLNKYCKNYVTYEY